MTLKIHFDFNYEDGDLKEVQSPKTYELTPLSTGFYAELWSVGSVAETKTLPLGDTGAGSNRFFFQNLDATNSVRIGVGTGSTYSWEVLPGEFAFVGIDSTATAIRAVGIATAGTNLLLKVIPE